MQKSFRSWTPIAGLFFACGPFAILWFIVSAIIFPFDGIVLGRAQAHVGNKISKFPPTLAYANATPAVSFVRLVLFICASLNHSSPYFIFRQSAFPLQTSACSPMCQPCASSFQKFPQEAATTADTSIFQVGARYILDRSAITTTSPVNAPAKQMALWGLRHGELCLH